MSVKLFTVKDACPSIGLPFIVLCKDFIEEAGFTVGRKFVAESRDGEIVLKLVDEEED